MAIADKLTQLNNVKLAIKQALINKGVSMNGVAFTDYASKIEEISSTVRTIVTTSSSGTSFTKGYPTSVGSVTLHLGGETSGVGTLSGTVSLRKASDQSWVTVLTKSYSRSGSGASVNYAEKSTSVDTSVLYDSIKVSYTSNCGTVKVKASASVSVFDE